MASVLVLVLAGTAFAYVREVQRQHHPVPGIPTADHKAASPTDGAENILVVGDDSRDGATPAELQELATTQDGGSNNTDTIILLHLAPNDGPATLISFPRDSYVAIPGYGMNKINAAFAIGASKGGEAGGFALLAATVEQLTGLHIDHFVSVGLLQFYNISNTIGGVNVCVVNPALTAGYVTNGAGQSIAVPSQDVGGAFDPYSGVSLPRGVSSIHGTQALAFVRQRHGLREGDIDRIQRQQRFLTAIEQKAKAQRKPGDHPRRARPGDQEPHCGLRAVGPGPALARQAARRARGERDPLHPPSRTPRSPAPPRSMGSRPASSS